MAADPCIKDTDCIALSIDPVTGELCADPILDPDGGILCTPIGLSVEEQFPGISADACNGLELRADGLWVGENGVGLACNSQPESIVGPLTPASGEVVIQTGEIAIQAPLDCTSAFGMRMESYGTEHVGGLSAGIGGATAGLITLVQRGRTKRGPTLASTAFAGEPFIDGTFRVLENNGTGPLRHAFGRDSVTIPFCPFSLGPGEWERFGYQRVAQVARGSAGFVEFQTTFLTYYLRAHA